MKLRYQSADDWLQNLFMKRRQGRRILMDIQPPYRTMDGMVFIDRRSRCDRRKALDPKHTTASAAS
jgi:hypothetical protein